MPENRAEQAIQGLDVSVGDGVVRVRDGEDTWLCEEREWNHVVKIMEGMRPIADDDGGGMAYTDLCQDVAGPIVSLNGSSQGAKDERANLIDRAISAGLIDDDEPLATVLRADLARGES